MIAKAIRVSSSGEKAAQRGTEAPRSQVQADVDATVFVGRGFFKERRFPTAVLINSAAWKPPLLGPTAQSHLLADAPGNSPEVRSPSRGEILRTSSSVRGRCIVVARA